mmetsp:Transcript_94743/g.277143  ORF Transcript_94743/g.277143 Transcript_94743/m.277143 type:complete len:255 (+) Transcript_94743:370-1134(+)
MIKLLCRHPVASTFQKGLDLSPISRLGKLVAYQALRLEAVRSQGLCSPSIVMHCSHSHSGRWPKERSRAGRPRSCPYPGGLAKGASFSGDVPAPLSNAAAEVLIGKLLFRTVIALEAFSRRGLMLAPSAKSKFCWNRGSAMDPSGPATNGVANSSTEVFSAYRHDASLLNGHLPAFNVRVCPRKRGAHSRAIQTCTIRSAKAVVFPCHLLWPSISAVNLLSRFEGIVSAHVPLVLLWISRAGFYRTDDVLALLL